MDSDKIVCYCNSITNGMIKEAVENGAVTLEEVQEVTNAGTVCGACIENIENLIKSFIAERSN